MSAADQNVPGLCKTLVQEGKDIILKETPVPEIGENEVLIRVRAIGLNPIDVSVYKLKPTQGAYIGCDFAGEVVRIGPNPRVGLKVGDKVSATIVGNSVNRGAFTEYAKTFSDLVWKIPDGTFSFEQAAATGSPLNTAYQALYGENELGLPNYFDSTPPKEATETWVFIYGGSSSVGQFAIQLANLSGYKVVTSASPRNHELLKKLGADAVFDYRDPDMVKKVKDIAGDNILHVFDSISEKDTQLLALQVPAENKHGKLVTDLPLIEGIRDIRKDVRIKMIRIFLSYGTGHEHRPGNEDSRRALAAFLQKVPELVKDGKLRHIPVKNFNGGLERVVPDGFEYLSSGEVSAERVVFSV